MVAMRRFVLGVTGILSLIFLLQILLSGAGHAAEITEGSWYDEVGLEKGVARSAKPSVNLVGDDLESSFAPATSACTASVLKEIGWTIDTDAASTRVVYTGGNPCDNVSLEESQSQGELRIHLPGSIDEASLNTSLKAILASPASVCAYKFKLGSAAARAARKLQANDGFYFYGGGSPFIEITNGSKWWGSCVSGDISTCFYPRSSNSDTLNDFYSGRIGTECALGLQAAEYSTLRELFGDSEFNSVFGANEIMFAGWSTLNGTTSATWGNMTTADTVTDRDASTTSKLGSQNFSGFSGYIGNVFGEAYLDHPIDRGENFMTLSVSLSAGAELATRGGFAYFNTQNRRIYELGLQLPPEMEQLALTTQDPNTLPEATAAQKSAFAEMQTILRSPVYTGYQVFVHPLGIMTLGQHIVRLLERNPRTPYAFQLYPSRFGKGLYSRYVNRLISRCGG